MSGNDKTVARPGSIDASRASAHPTHGASYGLANDGSGVSYGYDSHGRLTAKNQTADGTMLVTSHSYNTLGQREQTVTPSGQTIGYVWLNGKINAITVNGQPLVSQIVDEPDGQIGGWTWGNGTLSQRLYDLSGRPVIIDLGFDPQGLLSETRKGVGLHFCVLWVTMKLIYHILNHYAPSSAP